MSIVIEQSDVWLVFDKSTAFLLFIGPRNAYVCVFSFFLYPKEPLPNSSVIFYLKFQIVSFHQMYTFISENAYFLLLEAHGIGTSIIR